MEPVRVIQHNLYLKCSALSALYRLICSEEFVMLFTVAVPEQQEACKQYIDSGDKKQVLIWVTEQKKRNGLYDDMPTKDLRELGRKLRVKYYAKLSRDQLIIEVRRQQQYGSAHKNTNGSQRVETGSH